jgi:hypothetical protein
MKGQNLATVVSSFKEFVLQNKLSDRHSTFNFGTFYSSAFIPKDQTWASQVDFASW